MSIKNFSDELYVKTVESAQESYLGSFTPAVSMELSSLVLSLYKKGAHTGTEEFRIKIYREESRTSTPILSDTVKISDAPSITSGDWMGRIRFDFNRENMVAGSSYFVTLDPVVYTRNANVFYFSTLLDWPFSTNSQSGLEAGSKMELWGYE